MIFKPREFQKRSIKRIIDGKGLALFADMGTGKTSAVLNAIAWMHRQKPDLRVLIIAPAAVVDNTWPAECRKWENISVPYQRLLKGVPVDSKAVIYLTTPDSFVTRLEDVVNAIGIKCFDLLVIDESTAFKNPLSKRFKNLKKLLPYFKRSVVLTGTPTPKSLLDLWTQVYIVDRGASLGKSFYEYRKRYFDSDFMGYNWTAKPNAFEEVMTAITPFCERVKAADVIDLPGMTENIIEVILPETAMTVHREMKRDLVAALGEEDFIKSSAAAAYGACKQIATGLLYKDGETHKVHSQKIDMLKSIIESLNGSPLLVFSELTSFFDLCRDAGIDAPKIDGSTPAQDRQALIELWNSDQIDVLFAHPATVACGLNLQEGSCQNIVWIAPPDNLMFYDQGNARIYRQGVSGHVMVHILCAQGTVDEIALERLKTKSDLQAALLKGLEK